MMVCATRDAEHYAHERERVRAWRSRMSAAGRDIGRLPPVVDPELKLACKFDLELFALSYYPDTFDKPFSDDHRQVIRIIERAVLSGGLFALAMPRGSGKTSLCEVAALWAVLYGHHSYVLLVGATAKKAKQLLITIKTELRTNDKLAGDFPEVCFPIRALQGITNRSSGQRFNGLPTYMVWTSLEIVLPTIAGSPASGAIIQVAGITSGDIRGAKFKKPGGKVVRPSLVIPDDPQTDRSAKSMLQCDTREQIIKQAILGAAGPGKKMTVIVPCTVIVEGDLADRLLNRRINPEWNGLRTKTLYAFPKNMKLWDEYFELRSESLRNGGEGEEATAFYKKHRAAMDEGALVAWEHNFKEGELSALERAMKAYLSDRYGFAAEYQNEPLKAGGILEIKMLTAGEMVEKLNHIQRGELPQFASMVTVMIDVSQDVLWWVICGFSQQFDGALVDYGTWPQQNRPYFTLQDLALTIADVLPEAASLEEQIYGALDRCTEELLARTFRRSDGTVLRISREIIDAGYETKTVKKFCRESKHAGMLLPSHGKGITAKKNPISQWAKKEGEKRGEEWVIGRSADVRGLRHLTFDSNHWKTEFHKRLATPFGGRGSFSLCGDRPGDHRMIADHWSAEKPTLVKANGREVVEWDLPPHKPDNHWLDGAIGCLAAASIEGAHVLNHTTPAKPARKSRRKRVSYLE